MDVFAQYATDETKEVEGVWRQMGDAKLLIARSGNKKYARALAKVIEDNQAALEVNDDAAEALNTKVLVDVMADTVLLGWENLSFKGTVLEYTKVNARVVLAVKDFRVAVNRLATDIDAYKAAQEAKTEKN